MTKTFCQLKNRIYNIIYTQSEHGEEVGEKPGCDEERAKRVNLEPCGPFKVPPLKCHFAVLVPDQDPSEKWDNFMPFNGKLLVVNAMAAAQHHQDAGITRTAVKKWQTGMKLRSLR